MNQETVVIICLIHTAEVGGRSFTTIGTTDLRRIKLTSIRELELKGVIEEIQSTKSSPWQELSSIPPPNASIAESPWVSTPTNDTTLQMTK